MANPHKGEVSLVAGDETYILRLTINEICDLEELLNLGVNEIMAALQDQNSIRMTTLRTIFAAMLRGGGHEVSERDTGVILHSVGMVRAMEKFGEAFAVAFPQSKGGDVDENPTQAGTGKAS